MKVFTFFVVLLAIQPCFGQKNEYLVKHNGDTLFGNIKMRNNTFFISNDKEKLILSSGEVKQIQSDNYRGTTVLRCNLHTYTDNLVDLERGWVNINAADTTLILTTVYTSPKMNLYRGTDNMKAQYYFYKQPADSLPQQLVVRYSIGGGATAYINVPYPIGDNSRAHLQIHKGYVNQLRYIIGNCNLISEKMWEELDYRDYSLKEVVKLYNRCK